MADRYRPTGRERRWEPPAFVPSHTNPPASAAALDSGAVLVVDDRYAVRTSIAAILRSEGYAVTEAGDGQDALPVLKSEQFDAMVLDLRMPLVGGASLLAALTDPPPTVILSATEMTGEGRARVGGAVVAELTKPVAPQRLLDAVAVAVGRESSLVESGRQGCPRGEPEGARSEARSP
jgi:CheY-like chemotaxis protein